MILRIITGEPDALETLLQLELKKAPTAKQLKELKSYESREVSVVKIIFNEGTKLSNKLLDSLPMDNTAPDKSIKAVVIKVK
jgi:hypothetical protein